MRWCIVGTAEYQVGRGSTLSASKKASAEERPAVATTQAPETAVASTLTAMPWMWKSGMMLIATSEDSSCSVDAMQSTPLVMLPCVSGTIFGFLVVPDVCSTIATSSRRGHARPPGSGGRRRSASVSAQRSKKRPTSSSEGTSSMTGSALAWATRSAAAEAAAPAITTTALAGRSSNSNSNSLSVRTAFSGA